MSGSSTTGGTHTDSVGRVGAPLRKGDILDERYVIEEVLGVGGMGMVVAARHVHLDERVAIKMLLPGPARDREFAKRFIREAHAARKVKSKNVVRVLDVGKLASGSPYMVMELLDGQDLAAILRARGPLPVQEAVDYVLQAAEALAEAHLGRIVHRDLKPANLFVTRHADGTPLVKLLDFGISKTPARRPEETGLTDVESMLGSPHYMSPEQIRSTKDVDTRSDIWSLGVILFELVTKKTPFAAPSTTAVIARVLANQTPPSARSIDPAIPAGLDRAIAQCLVNDVERRYQSLAELARDLRPFGSESARVSVDRITRILESELKTEPIPARAESTPRASIPSMAPAPPPPRAATRRWLVGLAVLLAGALLTGLALLALNAKRAEPIAESPEPAPPKPAVIVEPLDTASPIVEEPVVGPLVTAPIASAHEAPRPRGVSKPARPKSADTPPKKSGSSIDSLINERK